MEVNLNHPPNGTIYTSGFGLEDAYVAQLNVVSPVDSVLYRS
jgi:hypothetical protein